MSKIFAPAAELANHIGHEFEPSAWLLVDQARIDAFADCTEDHQFIHVDPERARQTPFGGTIAHGFLSLSLLSKLCIESTLVPDNAAFGLNYGFDKVRFLAPVPSGKRIRARVKILDVSSKQPGRVVIKHGATIEIEGGTAPALSAEWLILWEHGA